MGLKERLTKESGEKRKMKTMKVSVAEANTSQSIRKKGNFVDSIFLLIILSTILVAQFSIRCDGLQEESERRERDEREGENNPEKGRSLLSSDTSSSFTNQGGVALPLRSSSFGPQKITFGAILPATALTTIKRAYNKKIADTVESIIKGKDVKFNFTNDYVLAQAQVVLVSLNPSPNEVLHTLCNQLLVSNITTVIYMTNSDVYVQNTASAQYLMQLTGYLGIPMIAWNADNIGLEQVRREVSSLPFSFPFKKLHKIHAILSCS